MNDKFLTSYIFSMNYNALGTYKLLYWVVVKKWKLLSSCKCTTKFNSTKYVHTLQHKTFHEKFETSCQMKGYGYHKWQFFNSVSLIIGAYANLQPTPFTSDLMVSSFLLLLFFLKR